MVPDFHAGR